MEPHLAVEIQLPADKYRCIVTGSEILADGRLIVCEYYNKCVMLFDSSYRVSAQLELSGHPGDITAVADNEVIVIMRMPNDVTRMQFVIVNGDKLVRGNSFQSEALDHSIAYCDNRLFVSDNTDRKIKVLDMTGRVITMLNTAEDKVDSTSRRCIAVNPGHRVVYVANPRNDTVMCMTMDGEILSVYSHETLGYHEKLAIHPDGSLYVSDWLGNRIHHITSQCTHIETILDKGELKYPRTISCNPAGDSLYVSESDRHHVIKVFKLGN